jgi:hypothetical protein
MYIKGKSPKFGLRNALACVAFLVGGAGAASAGGVSYSDTFNVTEVAGSGTALTADFPLFDPKLGTLFEVDYQFQSIALPFVFLDVQPSSSFGTATGSNTATFTVTGPDFSQSSSATVSVQCTVSETECIIGSPVDIVPVNFDDPAPLDSYIGVGTFEADVAYANNFQVHCPDGASCTGGGLLESWKGTLTVSYFYNPAPPPIVPVPEPSTWALMLAGFAGLGYSGWRRRSAALAGRA